MTYNTEKGVSVGAFVNTFLEAYADYTTKQEENNAQPLTNLKLQKLLYFTYGAYCIFNNKIPFAVNKSLLTFNISFP